MKIGAQLYSVRMYAQTEAGYAEAVEKLAAIGYRYAQVSGVGPIPAERLAEINARFGMDAVVTHTPPARVRDETDAVVAEHKTLGARYVGIGSMPGEYQTDAAAVRRFIADFTPAAVKIRDAGLKFMYHNHSMEFERFGGKRIMDWLAEGFAPDLCGFTLDTYWVQHAGGNPAAWLRKLAGRVDVIHVKDMAVVDKKPRMAPIGDGNLDWPDILTACTEAGVKYAFVELDDCYGADEYECMKRSFDFLTRHVK